MEYWWVNLGQTYKDEIRGFMWSPQVAKNGRLQSYDNMLLIQPGDIIFVHNRKHIRAVGVAVTRAQHSRKPNFGSRGSNWQDDGWLLEVQFTELINPVKVEDHMGALNPTLPTLHSPIRYDGQANQTYLFAVPGDMAQVLIATVGPEFQEIVANPINFPIDEKEFDTVESLIEMRLDISTTEKLQLMKSRRGQGLFKANVRLVESACRVTGVSQISMLRASHIKPWKEASDVEKIDGFNGLLLAPHVDHLFDKGFITFEESGEMTLSPTLNLEILDRWGIQQVLNVGKFRGEQCSYLMYHQQNIFKSSA